MLARSSITRPRTSVRRMHTNRRHAAQQGLFKETIQASETRQNVRVVSSNHGYRPGVAGVACLLNVGTGEASNASVAALYANLLDATVRTQLGAIGASVEVYQTREETGVYVTCAKDAVKDVVGILGNGVANVDLSDAALSGAKAKQLALVDALCESYGHDYLIDHAHTCAYQGLPLGKSLYGSEKEIDAVTSADISAFAADHVAGDRLVFSASGDVNHADVESVVDGLNINSTSNFVSNTEVDFVGSEVRIRDESKDYLDVAVCFQGPERRSPKYHTALVFSQLIGDFGKGSGAGPFPMSPIVEKLTENEMVDDVAGFYSAYENNGMIGISARLDLHDEFRPLSYFRTLTFELKALARSHINEVEINRAQNALIGDLLRQATNNSSHAADMATQVLRVGEYAGVEAEISKISAVSNSNVGNFVQDSIIDNCPVVASDGINYYLPDYYHIRGMFK